MVKKYKLSIDVSSTRGVSAQNQDNIKKLQVIKALEDKIILVESQIGIGTMHNIYQVFKGLSYGVVNYNVHHPTVFIDDSLPRELIVVDVNAHEKEFDLDDVIDAFKNLGFRKIIIVARSKQEGGICVRF